VVPEIQAEAYFILGRNNHARGNIRGALPYYTQACKLWPHFALAQFRLAQVRTAMGDLFSATEAAEAAFELAPCAPEVLRLLGILRLERQLNDDALKVLRLAVQADKNDAHAWLALARAEECALLKHRGTEHEHTAIEMAIHAYKNACELRHKRGINIPYELTNNMGVLQLEKGNYQSASSMLTAALESKKLHGDSGMCLELGPTKCVENTPLWLWENVDGEGVWFDAFDPRTLWTNMLIEPPLRVDEMIRIGDSNVAIFSRVKATSICQKRKGGMSEEMVGMSHSGFLIHLSGPIRQFNVKTKSQPLYRLKWSLQTQLTSSTAPVYVNFAQLHAAAGASTAALELAKSALKLKPNVRCLLLLARLALDTNEYDQAQIYIDNAVELALSNVGENTDIAVLERTADALAVACALQYELRDDDKTLDMLEQLRSLGTSTLRADAYANITLGKLHFNGAFNVTLKDNRTVGENNHLCRAEQLKHAADCARVILRHAPSCAAAAHMLGLTLLELGQLDDAALIFERVRENSLGPNPPITSVADVNSNVAIRSCALGPGIAWGAAINLAHSHLLSRRWAEAAVGYAACVRAAPVAGTSLRPTVIQAKRADLNHWLARARHGANCSNGANRALSAAIHLRPSDHLLRFHSAVLILQKASSISHGSAHRYLSMLASTGAASHQNEAESSVSKLRVAHKVFKWLLDDQMCSGSGLSRLLPDSLIAKCDALLNKVCKKS
jgi:tetratricopeptide (TPR) repeat protein